MNTGETILHYKIIVKLGQGGMGVVYKAEDLKLKREVAIKFLPWHIATSDQDRERFKIEAQAAAALNNSNIATIYTIEELNEDIFIVMEFIDGQNLKDIISVSKITMNWIIGVAVQIAEGLKAAHDKGIVHRDMKSSNIMVSKSGIVKIMDFGLAKYGSERQITKSGTTLGTVAYMSPEQARGEKVDHRTDIWSLGVILYEMLTGQLPFRGDFDQAVMYLIMNEQPTPITTLRSEVPLEMEHIVKKAMQKSPGDRYQNVDQLLNDLKRIKYKCESGKWQPVKLGNKSKQQQARRSALSNLITAFIILVVMIILIFIVQYVLRKGKTSSVELPSQKTVAVLPFTAITRSEEDDIFAAGVHEDIITQLAKIRDLKVIARTSVMQYKNTEKRSGEIAKELGVNSILEGSVRRFGDQIRIVAQLIDTKTERHIWAETYDHKYEDTFTIQSDVAQKIAFALQAKLTAEEKNRIESPPTKNMAAYDYYLKGNYYWHKAFNDEGNAKAVEFYEKALEMDPDFALAYARLTQACLAMYPGVTPYLYGYNNDIRGIIPPQKKYLDQARIAMGKATELAPDQFETYLARGDYFRTSGDNDRAFDEYNKALLIQPDNGEILGHIAFIYRSQGKLDKALEYYKKEYELSQPGTIQAYWGAILLGSVYKYNRQWHEALKWLDIAIAINPEMPHAYNWKIEVLLWGYGDLDNARSVIEEGARNITGPKLLIIIDMKYQLLLSSHAYSEALAVIERDPENRFNLIRKGFLYSLMNNTAKAIAVFDSARIVYEKLVEEWQDNAFFHSALGLIYAGLGRGVAAICEGNKAVALKPLKNDGSFYDERMLLNLVHIYIMVGEDDLAIEQIETLLSIPGQLTRWRLKLDPRYDALRKFPGFRKLISD